MGESESAPKRIAPGLRRDSAGLAFLVHILMHRTPPDFINSRQRIRLRVGGEGRNRPSLVFHKPLEFNRLWNRLLFDYKRVAIIVNTYPAISFCAGFYPVKRVRAGIFAGTFSRQILIQTGEFKNYSVCRMERTSLQCANVKNEAIPIQIPNGPGG